MLPTLVNSALRLRNHSEVNNRSATRAYKCDGTLGVMTLILDFTNRYAQMAK